MWRLRWERGRHWVEEKAGRLIMSDDGIVRISCKIEGQKREIHCCINRISDLSISMAIERLSVGMMANDQAKRFEV